MSGYSGNCLGMDEDVPLDDDAATVAAMMATQYLRDVDANPVFTSISAFRFAPSRHQRLRARPT